MHSRLAPKTEFLGAVFIRSLPPPSQAQFESLKLDCVEALFQVPPDAIGQQSCVAEFGPRALRCRILLSSSGGLVAPFDREYKGCHL